MPPYAPTLMESTRAIGYSIEAAIADIIDNSVAATAGKIDIDFFPIGHSWNVGRRIDYCYAIRKQKSFG